MDSDELRHRMSREHSTSPGLAYGMHSCFPARASAECATPPHLGGQLRPPYPLAKQVIRSSRLASAAWLQHNPIYPGFPSNELWRKENAVRRPNSEFAIHRVFVFPALIAAVFSIVGCSKDQAVADAKKTETLA